MNTKRLLASIGVAGALVLGGVTAAVIATTGISGAQTDAPTTTVPPSDETPAPGTPAPDGPRSRENCPDKGGAEGGAGAGAEGTATRLGFRGGPRRA